MGLPCGIGCTGGCCCAWALGCGDARDEGAGAGVGALVGAAAGVGVLVVGAVVGSADVEVEACGSVGCAVDVDSSWVSLESCVAR